MADSDIPRVRTTQASKENANASRELLTQQYKERIRGVEGVTRERRRTNWDRFDLTCGGTVDPRDHYEHAGPERAIRFVRRPGVSESVYHESDQLLLMKQSCPEMEIVTRKDTKQPVLEDDTIAVSIPLEVEAKWLAEEQIAAEDYIDMLEAARARPTAEQMQRVADAARRSAHESGATGSLSPTHGLDYRTARARYTDEEVLMEEAHYRRGNRVVELSDQQAEIKERMTAARTGRKTFAMGAGFDKSGKLVR